MHDPRKLRKDNGMDEQRLYLMARFDNETESSLKQLYDLLVQHGLGGRQTPAVPYHITLGSFAIDDTSVVLKRAKRVCGEKSAFDIHLNHVGLFGLNVLFIAPSVNNELLDLHNALIAEEPTTGIHNWVAHTTLLIDEPESIHRAVRIVAQSFRPIVARVHTVILYEFFPSKYIGSFRLQT